MLLGVTHAKTESIKESVNGADGKALLYINITYPSFGGRDKFSKAADEFYKRTADAFYDFAKNILAKKPLTAPDKPMAAVLRAKVMLDTKKYLSVFTEASVFDGTTQNAFSRASQLWNRRERNLMRWNDVFTSAAAKHFADADRRIFYATEKGMTVGKKNGELTFYSFDELRDKCLLSNALTID